MASQADWDGAAYHRLSDPQFQWGMQLLETLPLRGDERVLDAGCGSGRLSAELLSRLPHGHLVALDSSPSMLDAARRQLAASGERVTFLRADLADFELDAPVDLVFSTAVFHWVRDHDAMFRALFRALRPGGALVAQFGGGANLRRLRQRVRSLAAAPPFAEYLGKFADGAHYESLEDTSNRLNAAGFVDVQASLHSAPTTFPTCEAFSAFIANVNLHRYVAQLPPVLATELIRRLADEASHDAPPYTLDYVRLTVRARRPD